MKIESVIPQGKYSDVQIEQSILGILNQSKLCSIATISSTVDGPQSHISTAFYCRTDDLVFYILTAPGTEHGKNLQLNDSVALAIYSTQQTWDNPKQGLQLFGRMRQAPLTKVPHAFATYIKEYPGLLRYLKSPSEIVAKLDSRFYQVEVARVKIFDEPTFGSEVWIEASLKV